MAGNDQKVDRVNFTRRYLDRMMNPPDYRDEELPTKTVKIFNRGFNRGTMIAGSAASVAANMGSIHFSGSHYDFGLGSHSLRITRRSVYVGSVMSNRNLQAEWRLHHSRVGTLDKIPFFIGTQASNRRSGDWKAEAIGDAMRPIYSLGPGTITSYFQAWTGSARVYASLEGVF